MGLRFNLSAPGLRVASEGARQALAFPPRKPRLVEVRRLLKLLRKHFPRARGGSGDVSSWDAAELHGGGPVAAAPARWSGTRTSDALRSLFRLRFPERSEPSRRARAAGRRWGVLLGAPRQDGGDVASRKAPLRQQTSRCGRR